MGEAADRLVELAGRISVEAYRRRSSTGKSVHVNRYWRSPGKMSLKQLADELKALDSDTTLPVNQKKNRVQSLSTEVRKRASQPGTDLKSGFWKKLADSAFDNEPAPGSLRWTEQVGLGDRNPDGSLTTEGKKPKTIPHAPGTLGDMQEKGLRSVLPQRGKDRVTGLEKAWTKRNQENDKAALDALRKAQKGKGAGWSAAAWGDPRNARSLASQGPREDRYSNSEADAGRFDRLRGGGSQPFPYQSTPVKPSPAPPLKKLEKTQSLEETIKIFHEGGKSDRPGPHPRPFGEKLAEGEETKASPHVRRFQKMTGREPAAPSTPHGKAVRKVADIATGAEHIPEPVLLLMELLANKGPNKDGKQPSKAEFTAAVAAMKEKLKGAPSVGGHGPLANKGPSSATGDRVQRRRTNGEGGWEYYGPSGTVVGEHGLMGYNVKWDDGSEGSISAIEIGTKKGPNPAALADIASLRRAFPSENDLSEFLEKQMGRKPDKDEMASAMDALSAVGLGVGKTDHPSLAGDAAALDKRESGQKMGKSYPWGEKSSGTVKALGDAVPKTPVTKLKSQVDEARAAMRHDLKKRDLEEALSPKPNDLLTDYAVAKNKRGELFGPDEQPGKPGKNLWPTHPEFGLRSSGPKSGEISSVADAVTHISEMSKGKRGADISDVAYLLGIDRKKAKAKMDFAIAQGTVTNDAKPPKYSLRLSDKKGSGLKSSLEAEAYLHPDRKYQFRAKHARTSGEKPSTTGWPGGEHAKSKGRVPAVESLLGKPLKNEGPEKPRPLMDVLNESKAKAVRERDIKAEGVDRKALAVAEDYSLTGLDPEGEDRRRVQDIAEREGVDFDDLLQAIGYLDGENREARLKAQSKLSEKAMKKRLK